MKFINHPSLDFTSSKKNYTSNYWMNNLLASKGNSFSFTERKAFIDRYGSYRPASLNLSRNLDKFRLAFRLHKIYKNYSVKNNTNYSNLLAIKVNITVINQERLYTKLKYSRTMAYDIVSGGIAALFAGLLGFLVSEKFGMELVDSGDFYYVWMYIVFLSFAIKPYILPSAYDYYIKNNKTIYITHFNLFYIISIRRLLTTYLLIFNLLKYSIQNPLFITLSETKVAADETNDVK